MKRLSLTIVPCFFSLFAFSAAAAETIHDADLRLLAIADRIQTANAPLCDRIAPSLGVSLQSRDQFAAGADPGFSAPVAFAAVLPGSPAAEAGIRENDGLVSINGVEIAKAPGLEDMPLRDSAYAMLGEVRLPGTLNLEIKSGPAVRQVRLSPPAECSALVEILPNKKRGARSDGRVIQIGEGLAARANDPELAVIFAHELAHSVLHHRDRLEALDVDKGLGSEFGRSGQLNGEAEIEADRLSVHLLANAGYDPAIAVAFWRGSLGKELSYGLLRSRVYSSAEGRAKIMEREIGDYLSAGAPTWPGHLLALRPASR